MLLTHYIALRYVTLHCIAIHSITLHCVPLHYITSHHVKLRYVTLHYDMLHYIILHIYIYIYMYLQYVRTYLVFVPCTSILEEERHVYTNVHVYAYRMCTDIIICIYIYICININITYIHIRYTTIMFWCCIKHESLTNSKWKLWNIEGTLDWIEQDEVHQTQMIRAPNTWRSKWFSWFYGVYAGQAVCHLWPWLGCIVIIGSNESPLIPSGYD